MSQDRSDIDRAALELLEEALNRTSTEREAYIASQSHLSALIRDRALDLLMSDRDGIASIHTGGAGASLYADQSVPPIIEGYDIVRCLGRGGMGAVWLAHRASDDFEHDVAIKVIKPGALSQSLIERFRRERQILARLNHPHIARLYDGGQTAADEPYIIMEFVAGETLRQWLTKPRSLARKLDVFRQIATAVEFAHQNLIVHRDLTPGNILIDRGGNAKLIDFGIARPQEKPDEGVAGSTFSGLSLTPGFAAPERTNGVGFNTLTDIYSLGKILALMIADVTAPELAAIADKAAAQDQAKRYSSVTDLIEEIERYDRELPIEAFSNARSYRFRKFVKREKTIALSLTALFLCLALGLAVSSWLYVRSERERALAERRFEQTRSLAKLLLFDVYDEVNRVPGATRARAMVAESGLKYLDSLAKDRHVPNEVRAEVGRGYVRLADVTGTSSGSSLGRFREGGRLLAQARAIIEPLYRASPDDPVLTNDFADVLTRQAIDEMYNNGRIDHGRKLADMALAVISPLAAKDPEAAGTFIKAMTARGDADGWNNEFVKASKFYERAESFAAQLPANFITTQTMAARAHNFRLLAESYHNSNRELQARKALDHAISLDEQMYKADPLNPRKARGLIVALWYSAVLDRTAQRPKQARREIERAMQLVSGLQERNPGDADMIKLYSTVAEVDAQLLADRGDYMASYALTDKIVELNRKKVEISENVSGARRSLAEVLRTGGTNHHNGGDYAGACRLWKEAYEIWQALDTKGELSDWDKDSIKEMRQLLEKGCDPPRNIGEQKL